MVKVIIQAKENIKLFYNLHLASVFWFFVYLFCLFLFSLSLLKFDSWLVTLSDLTWHLIPLHCCNSASPTDLNVNLVSILLIYFLYLISGQLQCQWGKHYSTSLTGTQGPSLSGLLCPIRCVTSSFSIVIHGPEIHNCHELLMPPECEKNQPICFFPFS